MIYIELALLAIVVVFIVEVSGVMFTLKNALGKVLGINISRLRPFDCPLCMVWWALLVYALCVGELSVYTMAYISLLSALSARIADIMRLCDELLTKLINRWM